MVSLNLSDAPSLRIRPALLVSRSGIGPVGSSYGSRDTGFRRAPALCLARRPAFDRARLPEELYDRRRRPLFPSPGVFRRRPLSS